MSFNKVKPTAGPFFLAAGASTRVGIWYGGPRGKQFGDDKGAQWIMADPTDINEPPSVLPASLSVSDFTKIREIWIEDESPTSIVIRLDRTGVRYEATVTNRRTEAVFFTLQGGGNV